MRRQWEWLVTAFMLVMLVVVLFVSGGLLLDAFGNYKAGIRELITFIEQSWADLQAKSGSGMTQEQLRLYRDQIEAAVEQDVDKTTMSFLFQIYTAALISAGVFVLSRSRRTVEEAKRETAKASDHVQASVGAIEDASNCISLVGRALAALYDVWLVRSASGAAAHVDHLPRARDSCLRLVEGLRQADASELAMDKTTHDLLLDYVGEIQAHVSLLPEDIRVDADHIVQCCDEAQSILANGSFRDRYEKRKNKLPVPART